MEIIHKYASGNEYKIVINQGNNGCLIEVYKQIANKWTKIVDTSLTLLIQHDTELVLLRKKVRGEPKCATQ